MPRPTYLPTCLPYLPHHAFSCVLMLLFMLLFPCRLQIADCGFSCFVFFGFVSKGTVVITSLILF
ncbi:hypothetical protein BZA77DRAFT_311991 [Pyronema omphalodes]|nr:hypothetical protein BZA77DRAFT_311991 [Pyronema omphalodes]